MARGIKAKPQTVNQEVKRISSNKDSLNAKQEVIFSYKYLDLTHNKFCIDSQVVEYFLKLISRLSDISKMTVEELRMPRNNKSLRSHAFKWDEVSENGFGIPNEEEIVTDPWQFCISKTQYGRVHGFIISNVFYVRWFDPGHKLDCR